jgi:hypothetical protein
VTVTGQAAAASARARERHDRLGDLLVAAQDNLSGPRATTALLGRTATIARLLLGATAEFARALMAKLLAAVLSTRQGLVASPAAQARGALALTATQSVRGAPARTSPLGRERAARRARAWMTGQATRVWAAATARSPAWLAARVRRQKAAGLRVSQLATETQVLVRESTQFGATAWARPCRVESVHVTPSPLQSAGRVHDNEAPLARPHAPTTTHPLAADRALHFVAIQPRYKLLRLRRVALRRRFHGLIFVLAA